MTVQAQIQAKYKSVVDTSNSEMKSLKNVLKLPRLCELYRRKVENITEEMSLKDYYQTYISKTTSEITKDNDLMEDLKAALKIQFANDPNISQFLNNTTQMESIITETTMRH